ncbi:MAG: O-antigen ligase family protein [Candidatus Omnitrophica bacterium]|nr:O-antigen ligase family protein [Candidatus Omnitrophota bacterium]
MKILLMLTQATLLFYGTQLFPIGGILDPVRFICYGLIIISGIFILSKIGKRKFHLFDLIAWGTLGFAFYSYSYSLHPKLTLLRSTANLLMYVAVFWVLWSSCRNDADVLRFVHVLILVWFVFYGANIAFLYFRPQDSFIIHEGEYVADDYQRFMGITINPNAIGEFSAIILPLVLWNFHRRANLLNLLLLMAVVFSFFYSFSRNAFIFGVIGSSAYFYLATRAHRTFIIVCTVFLIALMILYVDLFGLFLPSGLVREDSLMLLGGRLEAWQASFELINKHPFRGHGFGIEEFLFPYFQYRFEVHAGTNVHNSFLGLALQLGWIVALTVYIPLVIFLVRSFIRVFRLRGEFQPLTSALYASVLSGFSISFFESWLYSAGGILAFPFFTFLMLLMRLLEFQKNPVRLATA